MEASGRRRASRRVVRLVVLALAVAAVALLRRSAIARSDTAMDAHLQDIDAQPGPG